MSAKYLLLDCANYSRWLKPIQQNIIKIYKLKTDLTIKSELNFKIKVVLKL